MYELVVNGKAMGKPFNSYQDANHWYNRCLELIDSITSIELWKNSNLVQSQYN